MPTDADLFFARELQSTLEGEPVLAAAYLKPDLRGFPLLGPFVFRSLHRAVYLAITATRIVMVSTRVGLFAPQLENLGIQILGRAQVRGAHVGPQHLFLELQDGSRLIYRRQLSTRYISTQADFFAKVESLLGKSQALAAAEARVSRRLQLGAVLGAGLMLALVLAVLGYVALNGGAH